MTRRALVLLVIGLLIIPACGPRPDRLDQLGPLAPGLERMVRTELIFGLSKPVGAVSGDEFRRFVDEYISPRFRDGVTVFHADGQWLGENGAVEREREGVVMIIHRPDPKVDESLEFIREKYKELFDQKSVIRVDQAAGASF
ncbi:MAG: DUF3574 domain-containing protein [Pseudomonadota bacterium]